MFFSQFEPPVIIDPPNPRVGDNIRIGLHTITFPPCLFLPQINSIGQTHLFEFDDNNIDLTVIANSSLFCNPIPVSPAPREYYELGVLPEGEYSIETFFLNSTLLLPELVPPLPPPDNVVLFSYGLEVTFTVHPLPQVVDSISSTGLIYLLSSIFFAGLFFSRKIKQRSKT